MQILRQTLLLFKRLTHIFSPRPIYVSGAIFFFLFLIFTFIPTTTEKLELYLYDLKLNAGTSFRAPDPSLAVVGIDMTTLANSNKRWPWPREDVAQALKLLGRLNPRGIVVDILFQNADTEQGDAELESTIKKQGNLILISILEEKNDLQGVALTRFESIARLSNSAIAQGFVWGVIDNDGLLRSFKIHDERLNAQSAAILAFNSYYKSVKTRIDTIPAQAPVVFARKNGGIPVLSLHDIMKKEEIYKKFCQNKVLIFGVNAPVAHDFHNTPLGIISGAEVLAASIDTLISGRIGRQWFSVLPIRAFMAITGLAISWLTIMTNLSLLVILLLFAAIIASLLLATEIALVHLPIAPLIIGWAITSLTLSAARYFDKLFALQEMQHEAATARLVQEQLLPAEELATNGYKVFGVSKSATELGGDYFDYFLVKDRYILVIIGDATGHGVPSALAMAIGKATVLMSLEQNLSLDQLIASVNTILFKALRRKLMMTAAFLWVDTKTDEFEYRNCGHPYPYKFSNDGSVDQLAASGLFLGTKATYRPSEPYKGTLKNGERLLFYTDGLIESIPVANDQDAFIAFAEYLKKRPKLPVKEACQNILDHHPFFKLSLPQPDDFTVLLVEKAL